MVLIVTNPVLPYIEQVGTAKLEDSSKASAELSIFQANALLQRSLGSSEL